MPGCSATTTSLPGWLIDAGNATGEKLWRLPLGPKYDKMIDSKVADIKNTGGKWGGSISAAQFLQRFVKEGTPWAHLDIAGTAMSSVDSEINRSWGSGFGVRLLDQLDRAIITRSTEAAMPPGAASDPRSSPANNFP